MYKICFVCTNFNNSHYTESFVKSIENLSYRDENINIKVIIVDNCSNNLDQDNLIKISKLYSFVELIFNKENLGYFKGLNVGLNYIKKNNIFPNYIIIGNNDLEFSETFISQLLYNKDIFNYYPVISPNIITNDGEHQNPHVLKNISKVREFIFDLYYTNYFLSKFILLLSKFTKKFTDRNDERYHNFPSEIYQGHGSCYILGPLFLSNFDELFAPTFLMSEEFFLSYQLKQKRFSIYYTPLIKVTHFGHASLSNVPSRKIWNISKDSHKIYKKYLKIYNNI